MEAEPGHRAGLRTQNVLTGDGFGVPGASLDPSKQDPEAGAVPDHCPGARARAGPCLVSHLRGWWPPGTLQGLSLGVWGG